MATALNALARDLGGPMFLHKFFVFFVLAFTSAMTAVALQPIAGSYRYYNYAKNETQELYDVNDVKKLSIEQDSKGRQFRAAILASTGMDDIDTVLTNSSTEFVKLPLDGQSSFTNSGWDSEAGKIVTFESKGSDIYPVMIFTNPVTGEKIAYLKMNCLNILHVVLFSGNAPAAPVKAPALAPVPQKTVTATATVNYVDCSTPRVATITTPAKGMLRDQTTHIVKGCSGSSVEVTDEQMTSADAAFQLKMAEIQAKSDIAQAKAEAQARKAEAKARAQANGGGGGFLHGLGEVVGAVLPIPMPYPVVYPVGYGYRGGYGGGGRNYGGGGYRGGYGGYSGRNVNWQSGNRSGGGQRGGGVNTGGRAY